MAGFISPKNYWDLKQNREKIFCLILNLNHSPTQTLFLIFPSPKPWKAKMKSKQVNITNFSFFLLKIKFFSEVATRNKISFSSYLQWLPTLILWHHNPAFQDSKLLKFTVPNAWLDNWSIPRRFLFKLRTYLQQTRLRKLKNLRTSSNLNLPVFIKKSVGPSSNLTTKQTWNAKLSRILFL